MEHLSYEITSVKLFYGFGAGEIHILDDYGEKRLQKLASLLPAAAGLYIVGGAVRDCLLGKKPVDIDLAAKKEPGQFARRIARRFGSRVIHLHQNDNHLFRVVTNEYTFDVTALAGGELEADLRRRDFTINAMAYDPAAGRLIDVHDSRNDLKRSVVRMTSPEVFAADAIRLLRAFRMAACLGFSICRATLETISRKADAIRSAAGERVHSELFRMLSACRTAGLIRQMHQTGLLTALFPELILLKNCPPSRHHGFDGLAHGIATYSALEECLENPPVWLQGWTQWLPEPGQPLFVVLKLAGLLHDMGKPVTMKASAAGPATYHGHAAAGAGMAAGIARKLRCSAYEQKNLEFLIGHHMHLFHLFQLAKAKSLSRRAMGRFFRTAGEMAGCLVALFVADTLAKGRSPGRTVPGLAEFCRLLLDHYLAALSRRQAEPRLVSGRDLIEIFGLEPSPFFKTVLDRVAELYLGGVLTTREQALEWVAGHLSETGRGQTTG